MLSFTGVGRKETMIKFAAIVLFVCFAECAAGSCLNYGHACWGAHGKRSGNPIKLSDPIDYPRSLKNRWFLSKLVQSPIDLRYFKDIDMNIAAKHSSDPLFTADENELPNGQDQWHNIQDELSGDQIFDDNLFNSADSNRIRIQKVVDKREAN